ncbi:MAG: SMC family ATPase, partial [Vallitaleaceae bacterium]|nr:SMC family ATPase [Vallitaleaceae bacterium]
MKPILLKMTAFGPYLEETIDFKEIENKGIFLITGDTGSGKTTIFDAICVALFGESNGAERTAESFKSDFDGNNEIMSVEFSFELKGRFFRVARTPRQRRKKLRGEGFTDDLGDATLYETILGVEKPIEFFKGVNARIELILGLNARQFRQIVMIPQGQFRKLITEDSADREKILKSIFNVNKYEIFQNKISSFNKELENKLFERKNLLNVEVSHIKSPEGSNLEALIGAQQKNIRAIIDETEALINEDESRLQEILISIQSQKEHIQKLSVQIEQSKKNNALLDLFEEKQAEKIVLEHSKAHYLDLGQEVNMAERAFRIKPLEEFLQQQERAIKNQKAIILDKNQEVQRLEMSLEQSFMTHEQLKTPENLKGIETEKGKLLFFTSILSKVEGYENLKTDFEGIALQFIKEEDTIKSLRLALQEQQEALSKMTLQKEQLTGQLVDIEKTQAILVDLNGQLEVLNELENQCLDYIKILRQHDTSTKAFEQIKTEKEQHEILYEEQQIHWFEGQAGLLAQNLKEGDPCPVCGNTHTVKKAQLNEKMPTKEHLDMLKSKKIQLEQKFNICQMAVVSEEQNKTNKREQLIQLFKKVLEIFQVTLSFDREGILLFCKEQKTLLQTKATQTKHVFERLKEDNKRLNHLVADLEELSKSLKAISDRLGILQEEHHKTLEFKTTKESQLEVIEKDLPEALRKKKQLIEIMSSLENNIQKMERAIESSKENYEGILRTQTIAKTSLSEMQKVLLERESAYQTSEREFQQAL